MVVISRTPPLAPPEPAAPPKRTALRRVLDVIAVCIFVALAGSTVWFIHRYGVNTIYDDQWTDINILRDAHMGTLSFGTLWAQPILAFVVGLASTGAKPAFDSIAQTYVPPAGLGRAFARFETQLQICWVGSALIAVLVPFKFASGDVLIAAACAIAAAFHYSMRHAFTNRDDAAKAKQQPRHGDEPLAG